MASFPHRVAPSVEWYPNPARNAVYGRLHISQTGRFEVRVLDVLGREVSHVSLGTLSTGAHDVRLDTSTFAAGAYIVRLYGTGTRTRPAVVMIH